MATNCYEWVITQFAAASIGLIQVNINPAFKSAELEYALKKVECKGIILLEKFKQQSNFDTLINVCPELESSKPGELNSKKLPMLKHVIIIDNKKFNGCFNFKELLNSNDSNHQKEMQKLKLQTESSDPVNILFTSGTTGSPKGVTLSHHILLNNAYTCNILLGHDKFKNSKALIPLPIFHALGMVLGSLATICHGSTSVFPCDYYNSEMCLKAIEKEKCTYMYGSPTMFIDLINHPNLNKYDISSLNIALLSGSIVPLQVIQDCVNKLGIKTPLIGYGMTESIFITFNSYKDTFENRTKTIGRGIEHCELKVVDANGKSVPTGIPGELWIRGYNTMIGYWSDKEKTSETYSADRFLKTGDLVTMNENGYVNFMGRLKDLIIRGGTNIYPYEIEELLHKHPKIADAYVIGVPDERLIEEVCACIKLLPNETLTADEVKEFCKDKISNFKIPRYIEFVDQFPMTPTGKVQKNVLQNIISRKLEQLPMNPSVQKKAAQKIN